MISRVLLLFLFFTLPALAVATEEVPLNPSNDQAAPAFEIPEDIATAAIDPLASPDGSLPSPVRMVKTQVPPTSSVFYALPVLGFWLILRRRGRGFRL